MSLASVSSVFPGFSETIMGLMILEFRLTALKQPVTLYWFSVVEPEVCKLCASRSSWNVVSYYWKRVRSQEVLRWASVYLGCGVVPFGLESAIVEVPEAAQRTCHSCTFYCCCWQWVTGEFPEHLQLCGGSLFKEDFDLIWTGEVKPETLQSTLEPS